MLVKNWEELSKIPNESETHILEVNLKNQNGHLYAKDKKDYNPDLDYISQIKHLDVYLSTHTFYGKDYKHSTEIMKACGFDVEIDNWDKKEE